MTFRSLIICATPRSGTTLLCDLLNETGVAGRPNSFYRRESLQHWMERLGVAPGPVFDRRYLDAIIAEGTGDTGLFAMRVMWPSLPEMTATLTALFPAEPTDAGRIAAAFGPPLYLFVERRDKVAQAVSRLKAEQTGLWHCHADGSERERVKPAEAPAYDAARLRVAMAETSKHEANWRAWFAAQGIAPMQLSYEALSADPAGSVAAILAALARNPAAASRIAPRTAKLADAMSEQWAARFRAASIVN